MDAKTLLFYSDNGEPAKFIAIRPNPDDTFTSIWGAWGTGGTATIYPSSKYSSYLSSKLKKGYVEAAEKIKGVGNTQRRSSTKINGAYDYGEDGEDIQKGKSIVSYLDDYTVIDIETTGGSRKGDRITEIAAVRVRGGQAVQKISHLVNPQMEISRMIVEKTGITDDMVSNAPMINSVLPKVIDFIGNDTVVAHNANFDIGFISVAAYGISGKWFLNDFIDTVKISKLLFKEHQSHKLSDLVMSFGIAEHIEHRALSDAMMVYHCYEYMKKYKSKEGDANNKNGGAIQQDDRYSMGRAYNLEKDFGITTDEALFMDTLVDGCGSMGIKFMFTRCSDGSIHITHSMEGKKHGYQAGIIKLQGRKLWVHGTNINCALADKVYGDMATLAPLVGEWIKTITARFEKETKKKNKK